MFLVKGLGINILAENQQSQDVPTMHIFIWYLFKQVREDIM